MQCGHFPKLNVGSYWVEYKCNPIEQVERNCGGMPLLSEKGALNEVCSSSVLLLLYEDLERVDQVSDFKV